MEIISCSLSDILRANVVRRRAAEVLYVPQRCRDQGPRYNVHDSRGPVTKATSDLLMKAEDCEMGWRVDEASPKNIANAARQHKIIVPFTSTQQRVRNGFGQLFP